MMRRSRSGTRPTARRRSLVSVRTTRTGSSWSRAKPRATRLSVRRKVGVPTIQGCSFRVNTRCSRTRSGPPRDQRASATPSNAAAQARRDNRSRPAPRGSKDSARPIITGSTFSRRPLNVSRCPLLSVSDAQLTATAPVKNRNSPCRARRSAKSKDSRAGRVSSNAPARSMTSRRTSMEERLQISGFDVSSDSKTRPDGAVSGHNPPAELGPVNAPCPYTTATSGCASANLTWNFSRCGNHSSSSSRKATYRPRARPIPAFRAAAAPRFSCRR